MDASLRACDGGARAPGSAGVFKTCCFKRPLHMRDSWREHGRPPGRCRGVTVHACAGAARRTAMTSNATFGARTLRPSRMVAWPSVPGVDLAPIRQRFCRRGRRVCMDISGLSHILRVPPDVHPTECSRFPAGSSRFSVFSHHPHPMGVLRIALRRGLALSA